MKGIIRVTVYMSRSKPIVEDFNGDTYDLPEVKILNNTIYLVMREKSVDEQTVGHIKQWLCPVSWEFIPDA
jgi:hypothetical protein